MVVLFSVRKKTSQALWVNFLFEMVREDTGVDILMVMSYNFFHQIG